MNKEKLLNAIHRLYRKDKWLNDLFNAAGIEIDRLEEYIDDLKAQYFLDTATWSLDADERDTGLTANRGKPYEDRRAALIAKERASGKVDILLLQAVADAWRNGSIEVDFVEGKIQVQFVSGYGIPADLESLQEALDNTKPAHLAIVYIFRYLLIKDIHEVLTIDQMQALKINQFAGKEV